MSDMVIYMFKKLDNVKNIINMFPQLFDVKSDVDGDFDVDCKDGHFVIILKDSDGNRVALLRGTHLNVYHIFDDVDKYGDATCLDIDKNVVSTSNIDIGFRLPDYLAITQ